MTAPREKAMAETDVTARLAANLPSSRRLNVLAATMARQALWRFHGRS